MYQSNLGPPVYLYNTCMYIQNYFAFWCVSAWVSKPPSPNTDIFLLALWYVHLPITSSSLSQTPSVYHPL